MGTDIGHSHPDAWNDLVKWGKWIIDEVDACGFRFDASSLPNPNFAAMAEGSDLNLANYLEEVEKASPGILEAYIKQVWIFPTGNLEGINIVCHLEVPRKPRQLLYDFQRG